MAIVREDFQFLNPGQIPVVTFDQPPYVIAKQVQWYWPDQFSEDHFVVMLGLHIEMAASIWHYSRYRLNPITLMLPVN